MPSLRNIFPSATPVQLRSALDAFETLADAVQHNNSGAVRSVVLDAVAMERAAVCSPVFVTVCSAFDLLRIRSHIEAELLWTGVTPEVGRDPVVEVKRCESAIHAARAMAASRRHAGLSSSAGLSEVFWSPYLNSRALPVAAAEISAAGGDQDLIIAAALDLMSTQLSRRRIEHGAGRPCPNGLPGGVTRIDPMAVIDNSVRGQAASNRAMAEIKGWVESGPPDRKSFAVAMLARVRTPNRTAWLREIFRPCALHAGFYPNIFGGGLACPDCGQPEPVREAPRIRAHPGPCSDWRWNPESNVYECGQCGRPQDQPEAGVTIDGGAVWTTSTTASPQF